MGAGTACIICGAATQPAFTGRVLGKHVAQYVQCPQCQHLRALEPGWLQEAYGEAIARADTGLVARNLQLSRKLACVLHAFFDPRAAYLDTAGGTGLMTRLMRDIGFDFWWEDPYCANALAPGFEAPAGGRFEAVTAFEALEHMTDPLAFVRGAVERSNTGTLVFTTELFEGAAPPQDWWYYAFPTGQHISFFTARTLSEIARILGLKFLTARGLHLLTRKKISPMHYRWVVGRADKGGFRRVSRKMSSRTQADSDAMLERAARGA